MLGLGPTIPVMIQKWITYLLNFLCIVTSSKIRDTPAIYQPQKRLKELMTDSVSNKEMKLVIYLFSKVFTVSFKSSEKEKEKRMI